MQATVEAKTELIQQASSYIKPEEIDKILTYPEDKSYLKFLSRPITEKEVKQLYIIERIKAAIPYAWTHGLGLSAIQIGEPYRVAWYNIQKEDKVFERTLLNPEILDKSKLYMFSGEGCLSIPGKRFTVDRYLHIVVKSGNHTFDATGLEAVMIQHEIDHMDGILSFDRGHQKINKTGRNDPCPCGSGAKYKKCCIDKI